MNGENDFDIGTVTDQKRIEFRRIVELDFHVNGACLLFAVKNVWCDTVHMTSEYTPRKSVDTDTPRLSHENSGCIDLVHRCSHIQAAVIDQVD